MKQQFKITDYSPKWEAMYLAEKKELLKIFGNLLHTIHHIGSTAIPTTKAKPEIDILIVLKDVSDLTSYDQQIEALGYRVRGECLENGGTKGRYYYSKDINNVRTHKLHICELGHSEIMAKLLFVKYLKEHETAAKEYALLKEQLSQSYNYGNYIEKYLAGKSDFIIDILTKAAKKYKDISYENFC